MPEVHARVEGHASPRWDDPGSSDPSVLNERLSHDRATEVARQVRQAFGDVLLTWESDAAIDVEGADALGASLQCEEPTVALDTRGADAAAAAQPGDDRSLERVDLEVDVIFRQGGVAGASEPISETITTPANCAPPPLTRNWAIAVGITASGIGKRGGELSTIKIINRDTGDSTDFLYTGVGIDGGFSTLPAVSIGEPTPFESEHPMSLADFNLEMAINASVGVDAGPIGYGFERISFPAMGAWFIDVGGWTMGGVNLGGGVTAGPLVRVGPVPTGPCTPATTEVREGGYTAAERFVIETPKSYSLSLGFPTGSSRLSATERAKITALARQVMADRAPRAPSAP